MNNINILKFLCRKIQVRGNYLSIKKRIFNLLYYNNIVNFEIVLLNNLLKSLYKLISTIFKDDSDFALSTVNLHNFISFVGIVFRFVYNDFRRRKDRKFYLSIYISNLYSNLYSIINNKLDNTCDLYKFFYKNYLNYLEKEAKSGVYNTYAVENQSRNLYFVKYICTNKIYKERDIRDYIKNRYYKLNIINYINNIKKIKKFRMNCLNKNSKND